jgi:hypothetical protein
MKYRDSNMSHSDPSKHAPASVGSLARPHYKAGNYLATEDLRSEQAYRLQRLRRHNRYLHGWGRVCGLRVVPAQDPVRPWGVLICPGYALTCCGDEIEVSNPAPLDIRDYLWARPQINGLPALAAYVGIRFAEERRGPVAAQKAACQCDEMIYASRLRDSFRMDVLWTAPTGGEESPFDLCGGQSAPCPRCGEDPYIILASVELPGSEGQTITLERIHAYS